MHWFRYRLQTKLEKGVETRTWNLPCGVPPASLQTATSPSARPIAISNGETASKKQPDIHQDSDATSSPTTPTRC